MSSISFGSLFTLSLLVLCFMLAQVQASPRLFVRSALVNQVDDTVTLPLYRGTSRGSTVYYIVLDASENEAADLLGVNRAAKLQNALNTRAVQRVQLVNGVIDFPASVDFSKNRVVSPDPVTGFPPLATTQPGSVGEAGYSPLIQLPNNTILNAPIISASSGRHDKVLNLDILRRRVTLKLTNGFANGKAVKYLSTDASAGVAAALEASTLATSLDFSPTVGDDSTASSRAALVAFVNGATGASNPQRQGLNSALLDGLDPLNVLAWTPNQGRYSPLWDVHLARWNVAPQRQDDVGDVLGLSDQGKVSSPDGSPLRAANFVVNCPIILEL